MKLDFNSTYSISGKRIHLTGQPPEGIVNWIVLPVICMLFWLSALRRAPPQLTPQKVLMKTKYKQPYQIQLRTNFMFLKICE